MKAFPTNIKVATGGDGWRTDYGMDLRDYFAAKAMQAMVNEYDDFNMMSKYAYEMADAMMKAREL
jgi:hypothetical protein